MKNYTIIFKFKHLAWYTLTGIEAKNRKQALLLAEHQMLREIGPGHAMPKPTVIEEK